MTYQNTGVESELTKRWVTLYSHRGHAYKTWAWCEMPRIDESITQCSIYLYGSKAQAKKGLNSGGSGFLVGTLNHENPNFVGHLYAVTNSHVIAKGATVIRLNTIDGNVDFIETTSGLWTHSETADIAVLRIDVKMAMHKHLAISTEICIDKNRVVTKGVGPGDDTFVVGRFINHEGLQQNRPSVRFGTIAIMPDEKDGIQNDFCGMKQEAYLVETHTIPGYSGSPVFLHIPPLSQRPFQHRSDQPDLWRGPWLLGIDWGHILTYDPVVDKHGADTGLKVQTTTGMMCVSPAWHLLDSLESEELAKEREMIERESKQGKFKLPATQTEIASSEVNAEGGDAILKKMLNTAPKPNVQLAKKKIAKKSA